MAVRERTILWQFIDTEAEPKAGVEVTVKLQAQEQTAFDQIVVTDAESAITDADGALQPDADRHRGLRRAAPVHSGVAGPA